MNTVILEQVLAATRSYYEAFTRCDLEATMAWWSCREDISCIPPFGEPGFGREGVEGVYRIALAILAAESFTFEVLHTSYDDPQATVTCAERIVNPEHGHVSELLGTSIFVMERTGWRIVHRHVSWRNAGGAPPFGG